MNPINLAMWPADSDKAIVYDLPPWSISCGFGALEGPLTTFRTPYSRRDLYSYLPSITSRYARDIASKLCQYFLFIDQRNTHILGQHIINIVIILYKCKIL